MAFLFKFYTSKTKDLYTFSEQLADSQEKEFLRKLKLVEAQNADENNRIKRVQKTRAGLLKTDHHEVQNDCFC